MHTLAASATRTAHFRLSAAVATSFGLVAPFARGVRGSRAVDGSDPAARGPAAGSGAGGFAHLPPTLGSLPDQRSLRGKALPADRLKTVGDVPDGDGDLQVQETGFEIHPKLRCEGSL